MINPAPAPPVDHKQAVGDALNARSGEQHLDFIHLRQRISPRALRIKMPSEARPKKHVSEKRRQQNKQAQKTYRKLKSQQEKLS